MTKREELISRYERNLEFVSEFKLIYKEYLDVSNSWEQIAFFDSRITNRQYFHEIENVSNQEYSAAQHNAIKTVSIQEQFLDGYIKGIDSQYNNLSLLLSDIRKKLNK